MNSTEISGSNNSTSFSGGRIRIYSKETRLQSQMDSGLVDLTGDEDDFKIKEEPVEGVAHEVSPPPRQDNFAKNLSVVNSSTHHRRQYEQKGAEDVPNLSVGVGVNRSLSFVQPRIMDDVVQDGDEPAIGVRAQLPIIIKTPPNPDSHPINHKFFVRTVCLSKSKADQSEHRSEMVSNGRL